MRSALLAGSFLVPASLIVASPAMAQEAGPAQEEATSPAPEDTGEDIVITGSRIQRPAVDNPNPVISYSSENLQQSGRVNLTDVLVQNPALLGSNTSAQQSGSTGDTGSTAIQLLNLRNLGTNRTLVLIDGRRHVAGVPGTASVDINTLPTELVRRIDIQTGGASAVYGADGVSGVVNFILRRDFEGAVVRAQTGISEEGDAGNRFLSVTLGTNFAENRGNVALSYEWRDDDRVNSFDRGRVGDPRRAFGLVRNPDDFPDDPNVFDRLLFNDLRYADSSRDGAIDLGSIDPDTGQFIVGGFDGVPEFTGSGGVYDRGRLLPSSGGLTQGGSSTPLAGYQGDLAPQNEVHNVNLLTSFEVSPALRLYAQGKYAKTRSFTIAQPSFDFFTYLEADNAYLVDRFGAGTQGALISRDNFDFGIRGERSVRETWRGVVGADGRLSDNATYDLYYTYGVTDSEFLSTNYRVTDRYLAALDAVRDPVSGNIVCRSTLNPNAAPFQLDFGSVQFPGFQTFTPGANSGCRPLNVLGDGVADQAALDFINVDLVNTYKVQQHVVSGSISGDFGQFFELPGGPIRFAVGGEYRKEISDFVPDQFVQDGVLADFSQTSPVSGEFDVKEVFAELSAPLLRDVPFAQLLELNAAVRLSDYSTVGRTDTWSFSGIYSPIDDIRIRGTYSQAVRAPNIAELFSPVSGTFSFIDDPCDPENIPEGTEFRQANCTALLTSLGINPATFSPTTDPTATVSLPGRVGGNVNLSEETARTWTAGVVLQPSFIPGLVVTADWYDIQLKDAVRTATAQEIVDLCVDQPTLDNVFCGNIGRSTSTGYVNDYLINPQNVAAINTAGLDVQVNYNFEVANIGNFNLQVVGNYLNKFDFEPTPGAAVEISKLTVGYPEYSGTADLTWTNGTLMINYGLNFFSKTRRFTDDQVAAQPDISDPQYFFYREKWEHDVQVAVNVEENFRFYAGVNNLLNDIGDVASVNQPYSFLGRYFYAGARVAFGPDR
ncbi:TonB-dependent receptor [Sphingomonas sp. BGYR3]|uniref:TonB-dependent receptor domain-containing protein n=1 Tax=Sphingomonas sp. BGYR3 TaxID=2975483 RepID=UPI0021A8E6CD|nr:TonB-dependent receptor [Sphingomonas sp. BGYR3]MDG5487299.1 TonB-dependent receptor [Sphingomonas sp. BGYR3]